MAAIYLNKLRFTHWTTMWELNVAYEQTAGLVNSKSTQACGTAVGDAWWTAIKSYLGTDVTFESVHTRMVNDGPFPSRVQNRIDAVGTGGNPAIPSLLCVIANLRNGAGLLKRPGRVFISGLANGFVDDGLFNSGMRDAMATAMNAGCLSVTDATVQAFTGDLVVATRAVGPGPPYPYTTVPITNITIPVELGSQLLRKGRKTGLKV